MSAGTMDGTSPPRTSDDEVTVAPSPRRRWLPRIGIALSLLMAAFLITGTIWAGHYQPVSYGDAGSLCVSGPHLRASVVNTTGGMQGQCFIPPQPQERGSYTIALQNTGPFPVTLESISTLPGWPASEAFPMPYRIAGQPAVRPMYSYTHGKRAPRPRPLAGYVLQPGGENAVYVQIPLLTAKCWIPHSYLGQDGFWVTEKFLGFTHDSFITWTSPTDASQGSIISFAAGTPGVDHGVICPK